MKDKCTKYIRFALPILFMLYLGGIISFTHVHIINGVTIVHSHPYKNNPNGPKHEHTGSELQLLHQISTIQLAGSCLFDYMIKEYIVYESDLTSQPVFHTHTSQLNQAAQLRAPPFCA